MRPTPHNGRPCELKNLAKRLSAMAFLPEDEIGKIYANICNVKKETFHQSYDITVRWNKFLFFQRWFSRFGEEVMRFRKR